jgi:hypothetical protein
MKTMKDAISDHLRLRLGEVNGQLIDSGLIVADLRRPQILNLLSVLDRLQHLPAVDPKFPVSKPHCRKLQPHSVHLADEPFNVEFGHSHFHFELCNVMRRFSNRYGTNQLGFSGCPG